MREPRGANSHLSSKLRLTAASARLRGRPGRPRKPGSAEAPQAPALSQGHGNPLQARRSASVAANVPGNVPVAALIPRLLDLPATSAYLGVSAWTVRDLEAAGVLCRVRVPLPNGGELRKVLFDREDLDRLIAAWKERAGDG